MRYDGALLALLWRRGHAGSRFGALQDPALNAAAVAGFAGVHPVLRVDRDHVGADELAGLTSGAAKAIENRQILAAQHPDALIRPVDQIEQALLGVARELQAEAAARAAGFRTHEFLHQVLAVLAEGLDAVTAPIRHVDQAVFRSNQSVQRRVLLRRIRRVYRVLVLLRVVR